MPSLLLCAEFGWKLQVFATMRKQAPPGARQAQEILGLCGATSDLGHQGSDICSHSRKNLQNLALKLARAGWLGRQVPL